MDLSLIEWPSVSQNSYYALFRTVDDCPISFYFHLDDNKVKKRFEELVKAYGGDIVENFNDMTPYTALMVEDKYESAFTNRVSFRASYIIECVNDSILLNINFYIQNNNIAKFNVNDYMKVIYLREATFTADQIGPIKQDGTSCSSDNVNVSKPVINKKLPGAKPYQPNMNKNGKLTRIASGSKPITKNNRNRKCVLSVNNFNEKEIDFRKSPSSNPGHDSIEKPDDKRIDFRKNLSSSPGHDSIEKPDDRRVDFRKNLCSSPGHDSIEKPDDKKIDFRKNFSNSPGYDSIEKPDDERIDFRKNLSRPGYDSIEKPDDKSSEIKCLNPCAHCILHMDRSKLDCFNVDSINTKTRRLASRSSTISGEKVVRDLTKRNCRKNEALSIEKCKARKVVEEEECSAPENERRLRRTRNKRIKFISDDSSDYQLPSSDESWSGECPRNKYGFSRDKYALVLSEEEDEDGIGPGPGPPHVSREIDFKHSRYPYCREEKEAILRYIVKKEAYHNVGGANLWKKMELSNICPRRTWMSLQNHFKRSLIKELDKFQFLTKNQINLLRG